MTLGWSLWKIIALKLFILFAILKLCFFPDFLKTNFTTDKARANHVINELTAPADNQIDTSKGVAHD